MKHTWKETKNSKSAESRSAFAPTIKSHRSPLLSGNMNQRVPEEITCTSFTPTVLQSQGSNTTPLSFVYGESCDVFTRHWTGASHELQPWVTSLRVIFQFCFYSFYTWEHALLIKLPKGALTVDETGPVIRGLFWVLCDDETLEEVLNVLRISAFLNRCSHVNSGHQNLRLAVLQWLSGVSEPRLPIWGSVYIPHRTFINNKKV